MRPYADRYDKTFVHYRLGNDTFVFHISQDDAGALWISTKQGLYRLDPTTGLSIHVPTDASSLSSNDVKSTGEDRSRAV